MKRPLAVLGSTVFFFVAPGTVAGYVPWLLSGWRMRPPLLGAPGVRILGGAILAGGLIVVLESFARFALKGRGTPAPPMPTEHLVVTGLYRYVRNPMYVGVLATILGQGLLLGSGSVLVYAAVVALGFHLFVLAYEEPTLRRTFAAEYAAYCAAVPRWWPRLRPWRGS